jgi:hypothetical protein
VPENPQTTSLKVRRFNSKEVFFLFGHPMRRRILQSLASGKMKTAIDTLPGAGARRHTYLKQFSILCKAGVLIQKENPNDGRRPLYQLAPGVVVCVTTDSFTLDFGGGGIRFPRN